MDKYAMQEILVESGYSREVVEDMDDYDLEDAYLNGIYN